MFPSLPISRRITVFCFFGITASVFAQAPAPARPPLLFREEWKQPPYTGQLTDENRRANQSAVGNSSLELKMYGTDAANIGVYVHEGRQDLWTGVTTSPVAILLRHKDSYVDLTGLARLRGIVRSGYLHVIHPVIKLSDGTLVAGSRAINTNEEFLETEIAFPGQRWFKLDPVKLVVMQEVKNPDLSNVDEVGFVDLMPGGGHGNAGWMNVSAVELYAKGVPRK